MTKYRFLDQFLPFLALFIMCNVSFISSDVNVLDLHTNITLDSFRDVVAQFGPSFPDQGLQGRLVVADPYDGCGQLKPPPNDSSVWIVLIARSTNCYFVKKVMNAQLANYSAAIVHNFNDSDEVESMGGDGKGIKIPSTFITGPAGLKLAAKYNYLFSDIVIEIVEDDNESSFEYIMWPFILVVGLCFLVGIIYLIIKMCRDHIKKKVNRLSSKHLKKIPVRKFKKGDYYDTCAICLDEYEEGEKIRVLPCDHVYHTKCIDPWLTKNKKTCPVCKRRVIPGRDTDSESSDEGSSTQTTGSERTPLLQSSSDRQHALRGPRRFPLRSGQVNTAAGGETLVDLPDEADDVATRPQEPEEPGAFGGAGMSVRTALYRNSERRRDRKRKRTDRERLAARIEAAERTQDFGEGTSAPMINETREERRERRRKKKELKRSSRNVNVTSSNGESSNGNISHETDPLITEQGTGEVSMPVTERQETPPTRGKHHELNEVV